jgi:hypothetical protein
MGPDSMRPLSALYASIDDKGQLQIDAISGNLVVVDEDLLLLHPGAANAVQR